jgi:hypothetical protein
MPIIGTFPGLEAENKITSHITNKDWKVYLQTSRNAAKDQCQKIQLLSKA